MISVNNLISVFMNYKINRLVEYACLIYQRHDDFAKDVFRMYFKTYVDNYYYGVFDTIENGTYSIENLSLELEGAMKELLHNYLEFELEVSNSEYSENVNFIKKSKSFVLEVLKIDQLKIENKESIENTVLDFVKNNEVINNMIGNLDSKLVSYVRETFNTNNKLLNYKDNYFTIESDKFEGHDELEFVKLKQQIKSLDNYKKMMVDKVYEEETLNIKKVECLIQKISLELLKDLLDNKKSKVYILELDSDCIGRGKITDKIFDLIDNPLFKKYVVLGIDYNLFLNQRSAFDDSFTYACLQDYSHINDIYLKTENIVNEGFFSYLVVVDYRYRDRDFFVNYENENIAILLYEEG